MEYLQGLQQLGLSEYEAWAYAALLSHPGATGYEVAKRSGVPRAKVYEVLESLVAKGVAHTSEEDEKPLYHPLPCRTLLQQYLQRAQQITSQLGPVLEALSQPEPQAPLVTVRGYERLVERAAELVDSAQGRVFASGWPAEMQRLAPAFQAAERRGVAVFALVYGQADLGLQQQFFHPVLANAGRLVPMEPALAVAADHTECVIAEMAPGDRAAGLWTRNRAVTVSAAEFIKHDIYLNELTRRLGAIPAHIQAELACLQKMWFS